MPKFEQGPEPDNALIGTWRDQGILMATTMSSSVNDNDFTVPTATAKVAGGFFEKLVLDLSVGGVDDETINKRERTAIQTLIIWVAHVQGVPVASVHKKVEETFGIAHIGAIPRASFTPVVEYIVDLKLEV